MFDARLIALLDHPDSTRRKQAIKALAKSKDREALDYLNEVALHDDDASVREMARKASVYIESYAPLMAVDTPHAASNADDDVFVPSYLTRDERPSVPLYDPLTGVDECAERERAQRRANPSPAQADMPQAKKRRSRQRDPVRTWHYISILAVMAVSIGALVAFVRLQWYDFETKDFLPDAMENRRIEAEFDFRLSASSLATLAGEWTFEQEQQGLTETWERDENQAMEYTLLLIPMNAVFQIGIGALTVLSGKRADEGLWTQMIVLSLLALIPFGWALYNVKSSLLDIPRMYRILEFEHTVTDFMGTGFWVMLACTLLIFVTGFSARIAFDED